MTVLHVAIVAELVDANSVRNVNFPGLDSNLNLSSSIFIPASYIQQRSDITGKLSP